MPVRIALFTCALLLAGMAHAGDDAAVLFTQTCGNCHDLSAEKMGPPVLRMTPDAAYLYSAIAEGISDAGPFPMPAFAEHLKEEQIKSLVSYILSVSQNEAQ